jgi:hypothetical protein
VQVTSRDAVASSKFESVHSSLYIHKPLKVV